MNSSSRRPFPTGNAGAGLLLRRLLGAAVAIAAAVMAWQYLFVQTGGIPGHGYTSWYEPSALWAAGHGWVKPAMVKSPHLTEFIEGRAPALDTSQLVGLDCSGDLDANQRSHFYLLRMVGLWWWLFGISWSALAWMQVAGFALSAWLLYRLLCVAGPPVLAAAGAFAFVWTPGLLQLLPTVRDFNKIPFLFAAFWVMALLLREPRYFKERGRLALLLGVVIGLGVGFRQDVLALLPAAALAVAAAPGLEYGRHARRHAAGLAVASLFAGFLLFGGPILLAYSEGTQGAHQFVMGLAADRDTAIGLEGGSYVRVPTFTDNMATVTKGGFSRRVHGTSHPLEFVSPAMTADGLRFASQIIRTFPADMITRAYAAVLWSLRGCPAWEAPPALLGYLAWGPVLAVAFFAMLGAWNWRRALVVLVLIVYLGAYTTVQFEPRHALHLAFLPSLFAIAIAGAAWRAMRAASAVTPAMTAPALRSLACFAAAAALLLVTPLALARAVQQPTVARYGEAAANAALEPFAFQRVDLGDYVVFRPEDCDAVRDCGFVDVCEDYFVAVLSGGVEQLGLSYDAERDDWDTYRFDYVLPHEAAASEVPVRVFLPVYEVSPANQFFAGWSRFAGIVLRAEDAGRFEGLYRVADPSPFPLFLMMSVKENAEDFQALQYYDWTWTRDQLKSPPPEHYAVPQQGIRKAREIAAKEPAAAAALYREVLQRDPRNLQALMDLARLLEQQGDAAGARERYEEALRLCPDFEPALQSLGRSAEYLP